jgi:hypothetical protein
LFSFKDASLSLRVIPEFLNGTSPGFPKVINNSRFLILPHVRVPHLASHILGTILRRLRSDWQRRYNIAPCLAETFVERERFAGICYRAANWLRCARRAAAAGTIGIIG